MNKKVLLAIIGLAVGLAFFVPSSTLAVTKKVAKPVQKDYDYELVDQQPSGRVLIMPGESKTVWIEVKNTGTKTWNVHPSVSADITKGAVRLGTGSETYGGPNQQKDHDSIFVDDNFWISSNRPTSLWADKILPGWHTRFQLTLKAPLAMGVYKEYFTPVVEGVEWMKDIGIHWEISVPNDEIYMDEDISNNGGINVVTPGYTYKLSLPGYYGSNPSFNNSVLKYTPDVNCNFGNTCATRSRNTHTFEVISDGYSKIEFDFVDPSDNSQKQYNINIVSGRRTFYEGTAPLYSNFKKGDIFIIKLPDPGDGGYLFNEPEFPVGRVIQHNHIHLTSTSGLLGDFGYDQWVFEVLDSNPSNYIQIRASQPWVGGDSITSFLLNINPIIACGLQNNPC